MLYPDLVSALHGEAERGAAVPVLGGRHHPAVTRQVRADAAVGEPEYSTVQYSTVQYSTVQYSTAQYSTVQPPPTSLLSVLT